MVLYLTFCSWVFLASFTKSNSLLNSKYTSKLLVFLFIALAAVTIPQRDLYQGDMINYFDEFREMHNLSLVGAFREISREPLFLLIQWVISRFTESITVYVVITWIAYAVILTKVASKIVQPNNVIFILFGYLNFIFLYEYLLVGTRQGFAMMFMLLTIAYWQKPSRTYKFYLAAIASVLCHYSAAPIVLILLVLKWRKSLKLSTAITIWIVSVFLFVTKIHESLMMKLFYSSQFMNSYTTSNLLDKFGFTANRIDYMIFSGLILVVSLIMSKYVIKENKELYNNIIKSFVLINCYFLLFGFIAFAVRIAVFSWFMIPLLLWYPIINQNKIWIKVVATVVTFSIGISMTIQYFKYQ